jgi:hypothetical protein
VPIGHHPFDLHAEFGEVSRRIEQEPRRGGALLVGMDLNEGHPGVIVHSHVQEVVATRSLLASHLGAPAEHPMSATGRDAPELLHIDVHELPGTLPLVADGDPRGAVGVLEP